VSLKIESVSKAFERTVVVFEVMVEAEDAIKIH